VSAVAAATPQADVTSPETYAARLYERHNRAIYGLCLKELRSREDADDALQTTFIYALLSLRRGVVPQLELPWLYTIARNACSTRRRSGARRGAHEYSHDLDSLQDRLATPDRSDVATSEDFLSALRAIPERQRKALLLREWQGLSYEEIGSELGLSQAATEALLFRARQNVAQRLGQTVGLKVFNGVPLLTFLRNFFQTAAAKTLAVGAGAALTIAAIPAAESRPHHVPAPQAVAAHVGAAAGKPPALRKTERPVRGAHAPGLNRDASGRANPIASHPSDVNPAQPPATVRTPTTPAPSSPPSSASDATATPTPLEQVGNVVDTASDAGAGLDLPEISLPPVTTPTLPVQPPTLSVPSLP
jgi:RNA polymerase sigma factor (sigma-70 family)